VIKAQYSDANIQDHGFQKHIHHVMVDMGVYPNDHSARLVELYKVLLRENPTTTGSGGGKPRNIELYRKALGPGQDPSTGLWNRLEVWDGDGTGDYDDASSSGSVTVDPQTGQVHVALVFGKTVNGAIRFQDWEQTIERATFAPAIVRPPTSAGSTDPALVARVTQLEATVAQQSAAITALETALANITTEWLSTGDRAVLDWAAQMKAAIRMA